MMYGVRPEKLASDSDESPDEEGEGGPPLSEEALREDPDLLLVPTIVNKVVLPKVTGTSQLGFAQVLILHTVIDEATNAYCLCI